LPTVAGTATSPREIRIVTVEPRAILAPAAGVRPSTVPVGFLEKTLAVSTSNPLARNAAAATAARLPTTFGTTTARCAETATVTTE
jgi:hypothetical protein